MEACEMKLYTIQEICDSLPKVQSVPLTIPQYTKSDNAVTQRIMLQVESMSDHMSNEGHQLGLGLRYAGYKIAGYQCPDMDSTFVPNIIKAMNPDVVVMQDIREFDNDKRDFREPLAKFNNVEVLSKRADIFKIGVLKDAHQRPEYHRKSFSDIGAHAIICYYHPAIVHHLAPYTRPQHLIRTFHSIDKDMVLPYSSNNRKTAIISGAIGPAYPLRKRLIEDLRYAHVLKHPSYHRRGTASNEYLKTLAQFNVSIVTSSIYGYSLRKIIESTVAGCRVVTNLPCDDVLPYIDDNLIRIHPDTPSREVWNIIQKAHLTYDPQKQEYIANLAKEYYDYRTSGLRLAQDIENLRRSYCKHI